MQAVPSYQNSVSPRQFVFSRRSHVPIKDQVSVTVQITTEMRQASTTVVASILNPFDQLPLDLPKRSPPKAEAKATAYSSTISNMLVGDRSMTAKAATVDTTVMMPNTVAMSGS